MKRTLLIKSFVLSGRLMTLPRDRSPDPVFPVNQSSTDVTSNLLYLITSEEINKCFPRNGSAPGPDLLTVGDLKHISRFELAKIFNIFLLCRRVPDTFCRAKAIFLPKKTDALSPGDFRPISLIPIPARLFSKILARRLSPVTQLKPEQRGFVETDGISQNIFMLDYVLHHAREKVKRTYIEHYTFRRHLIPSRTRLSLQPYKPGRLIQNL
ncbi:Retrovirus-related Pol polyprotein from type-2 retrotransposable element R2DM [Araneus ventricosus]|uniref:Retrovirus-related Pol polyprotein from type-2 retrotransposable element R2DM n=1 Tax=Araneus ventricosus TaxID=182803 RepID=A0A4Y2SMP2_ARAVE|nr:Retrovirus-related Pol polyprotein from type-2 retrotransposable element R2DM [Araneus ventricosus]